MNDSFTDKMNIECVNRLHVVTKIMSEHSMILPFKDLTGYKRRKTCTGWIRICCDKLHTYLSLRLKDAEGRE